MPRTTTQELYDDLLLKDKYIEKDAMASMQPSIPADPRLDGQLVRDIVGRNLIDPRKFYGVTTYKDDYELYNGQTWAPKTKTAEEMEAAAKEEQEMDVLRTTANKDQLSQFTEKFVNKRIGRNTWRDETGVYGTALHKRLNTVQFNPLLNAEER